MEYKKALEVREIVRRKENVELRISELSNAIDTHDKYKSCRYSSGAGDIWLPDEVTKEALKLALAYYKDMESKILEELKNV